MRKTSVARILGILLGVFCFSTLANAQNIPDVALCKNLNTAHRGASAAAPENTLAAYRRAVQDGATGAECDVRMTKDGVLILHNDATVKKIGGGDLAVSKLTLEEIRQFDAGSWKDAQFKGEKVPTLEEFLLYLKDTKCNPVIEAKIGGIEAKILDVVKKTGMSDRTTVISFSPNVVKAMRELAPEIPVAWLFHEDLKDKGTAEENAGRLAEMLIEKCKELNTNLLDLSNGTVSKTLVKKLNEAGVHVWCYTVDDPLRMKTLIDWGVESITTNHPGRMTTMLQIREKIEQAVQGKRKPGVGMPVHVRRNVAHRGASFDAPENTVPAFKKAIADGANGAECDIYEATDGVVFLTHDHITRRTLGGGDHKVWELPYTEIRKRDAGVWKDEKFKGTYAPTLDEYLQVLKGSTCHPVIEVKRDGFEQKVVDAVKKADMLEVSTVIAFSTEVVRKIRKIEPKLSIAWLYGENMKGKNAEAEADRLFELLIWRCHELDTCILDLQHDILSEKLIKKLQAAGIHVWCWTVNDAGRMNQLLDWGIESITTDRPDVLSEVLKKRQ